MDQAKSVARTIIGEDIYFGDVNADQSPDGFGLKADGSVIEGAWTAGSIHGQGLQVYPNGDSYVGSFQHGEVAGMGKFVNYRGVGNSKQNGEGTETWADGAVYQGHFKDGKKEGFGKFLWADKATCMALDASFGLMGRRMKAATRTTRSTAKAFSLGPMASSTTA